MFDSEIFMSDFELHLFGFGIFQFGFEFLLSDLFVFQYCCLSLFELKIFLPLRKIGSNVLFRCCSHILLRKVCFLVVMLWCLEL